jgi:hypothetical protein
MVGEGAEKLKKVRSLEQVLWDKAGDCMLDKKYKKGPKLFSLARKRALSLDIPQEKGVKLAELICRIQEKEGNPPCFRRKENCSEASCCWQASCNAIMEEK